MSNALAIGISVALVALSAFFVAVEFALVAAALPPGGGRGA